MPAISPNQKKQKETNKTKKKSTATKLIAHLAFLRPTLLSLEKVFVQTTETFKLFFLMKSGHECA